MPYAAWLVGAKSKRHRVAQQQKCVDSVRLPTLAREVLSRDLPELALPSADFCEALANRIGALVSLEPAFVASPLDILSPCQRAQINFWKCYYPIAEHFDEYFVWDIIAADELQELSEHSLLCQRKVRSFITLLEQGHSERLCRRHSGMPVGAACVANAMVPFCIHLPAVYVALGNKVGQA